MTTASPPTLRRCVAALAGVIALAGYGCAGNASSSDTSSGNTSSSTDQSPGTSDSSGKGDIATGDGSASTTTSGGGSDELPPSDHLGDYSLTDEAFGTEVTVTVSDGIRTIVTNALPNHKTGTFPNPGNPNTISAQRLTWEFPAEPTPSTEAKEARVPGVAVNGVKFEPGTAETVSCTSGESYRVEALQDLFDLGLDFNNAHVQPTGEYHYHGVSELLVGLYATDADLVHVGFAADGHLIYYSKSGAFTPGYRLDPNPRAGTGCTMSLPGGDTFDVEGSEPDGTYTSDWVFDEAIGNLDQCNGTTIGGEYVYLITSAYPYVSRCLTGEFTETGPPAGAGRPPGGAAGPPPGAAPR
jgi:hypothetical protein